ncbi:two-component system response regulator YesN [Paenibacillus endophyticus]|uniref:Two-component system response regulator YesN n=1 Tax=Paenibacillus endophyticus TaxID=1294268 RepID=A0A7W5CDS2_9BACL|nr:response regulator [Paenibacillus endophyticus]MBB3155838.1 two-component system response regulator YesN [Paenibacillus endophyticus]
MKLLLVEDEQLIRQGILMKTDWQQHGIDEVRQAEDGFDAVRIAEQFRPDILLTDIRMPRMDGIEAARSIRSFCPKVRIIFMSGFSDKEYLKAAISLQAVHYVEKPIQPNELNEAIRNASDVILKERQIDLGEEASIPLIKREIAALLCSPVFHADKLERLLPLIGAEPDHSYSCASSILKWHHPLEQSESVLQQLESAALTEALHCFCTMKDDFHIVIHLTCRSEESFLFEDRLERWIHDVSHRMPKVPGFHMAVGRQVRVMDEIYDSYLSAVIQLQRSFYEPPNTVVWKIAGHSNADAFQLDERRSEAFALSLQKEGPDSAKLWLADLARDIRNYPDTQVAYTKGLYLQLYQTVQQVGKESGIPAFKQEAAVGTFAALLYACQSLCDLHRLLNNELDVLFNYLEARKGNSIIRHVIQYIERNYRNRQLTLTEISEYVGVTIPHMCFVFKEGTGTTIKNFLSEYRIDRAKELLASKDLKLFDIALQVGYGDGEYFSKIFKKVTGLQPSEYRKRIADV